MCKRIEMVKRCAKYLEELKLSVLKTNKQARDEMHMTFCEIVALFRFRLDQLAAKIDAHMQDKIASLSKVNEKIVERLDVVDQQLNDWFQGGIDLQAEKLSKKKYFILFIKRY